MSKHARLMHQLAGPDPAKPVPLYVSFELFVRLRAAADAAGTSPSFLAERWLDERLASAAPTHRRR